MSGKLIFISAPYRHDDPEVMEQRVLAVERYFLKLLNEGHFPVSPVANGHYLVKRGLAPDNWGHWQEYCNQLIFASNEVHVLKLGGWSTSQGVNEELVFAQNNHIPVVTVDTESF